MSRGACAAELLVLAPGRPEQGRPRGRGVDKVQDFGAEGGEATRVVGLRALKSNQVFVPLLFHDHPLTPRSGDQKTIGPLRRAMKALSNADLRTWRRKSQRLRREIQGQIIAPAAGLTARLSARQDLRTSWIFARCQASMQSTAGAP